MYKNYRKYQGVRFGEKGENPCLSQRTLDAKTWLLFVEDHPATKRLVELKDKKPKVTKMNISDESDNLLT